jgi:putative peptide zinc metalloprotease protein
MADTLFSPSWYRVAELKPRMRTHAQIHRHDYRGKVWFILQDHMTGRSHRFSPAAYSFIGLMDGKRTVQEIWDALSDLSGDKAPTQDEVIRLLGQLHAADALMCDVTPDSQELFRRYQRQESMKLKQKLSSPMAIRIPLFDPERFLERTLPFARLLFNRYTALLWLVTLIIGGVLAAAHWEDLSKDIIDRALTPQNLLLIWLIYPVVKALHELGHAYLTKICGGEVHEIGIMLLVLMPVPYVDVSSAWGLRDKRKRMAVGAIGIAVEMFLGALALFVWLTVESGTVHAIAYNVMLISGVSTLLFNGNPLLRFDGYYVLADAIEIPNLGTRANKYLGFLFQRYVLGVRDAETPSDTTGERIWFVVYGIAAFIYRVFIMFAIVLYIGGKFFAVGVALAIWAVFTQGVLPIGKAMNFLFNNPKLKRNRKRSTKGAVLTAAIIFALLFVIPMPLWTRVEGVTWPSEKSQVRAAADGFVVELLVPDRSTVSEGQEIISTRDPLAESRVKTLEAREKQLNYQLMAARTVDRAEAGIVSEELNVVSEDLDRARERSDSLVIRSPRNGVFVVPQSQDLPGRFVRQGQLVAFVIGPADHTTVRAAVSQDDIGLVREGVRNVDVISAGWHSPSFPAQMVREIHGGTHQLPTAALGTAGGGPFAINPSDKNGRTTLERVFEIEINLPPDAHTDYLGSRMYVRFDHGYEPLAFQAWHSLRQLFLRRFGV